MTEREQRRVTYERGLIGNIFATDDEGIIFSKLEAEDFRIDSYRKIFEQAVAFWKKAGKVTVADTFRLPEAIQTPAKQAAIVAPRHTEEFIPLLKTLNAVEDAQVVASQIMASENLDDLAGCSSALSSLLNNATVESETVDIQDLLLNFVKTQSVPRKYFMTGISSLDRMLRIEPGDYVVIGARPSEGKTALALNLARGFAGNHYKVGFFSLETSPQKLIERLVSATTGIDYGRIKEGKLDHNDWAVYFRVSEWLSKMPIHLIQASGKSVAWIRAEAIRLGLDVAIIDYLSLIRGKGKDIYERVTTISMELHEFAQQTRTVVVALSQLNRTNASMLPTLDRLRESGQVEQDADAVILLHNPPSGYGERDCMVIIAKNKEGVCGAIEMVFDGAHQRFLARDAAHKPEDDDDE